MRRVVVTGFGAITPLGINLTTTWSELIKGRSGIRKIPSSLFNTDDLRSKIAGIVALQDENDFEPYITKSDQGRMGRFIKLAVVAAAEAIKDSGIESTQENSQRIGVLIGSGIGGLIGIEENALKLEKDGARKISPFFIPSSLINLASGYVAMNYNFAGPNDAVVTACASGSHAIGDAARIIIDNDADVMVCGGTEAAVCRLGIAGFAAARALSTRNDEPEKASRPWDNDRDGFVMSEGAGVLVLEEYEHAKKRGAKIYAELAGYGMSGDAYHITSPHPEGLGAYSAMDMAIKKSGLKLEDIGYINAHGTSTLSGDIIEINAVKRIFGDLVYKLSMSSTKSSIGHMLGAAGSVEAIFAIKTMLEGILPPTINLDNPSEGCKDIDLVPNTAKEIGKEKIKAVLTNSFGFGGTNASLIFKRV
jgi:3-oxoacyl-[acyl-carrier-protein] synthase II